MTRAEALAALQGPDQIGYDTLDAVFLAFGFVSQSPDFCTEVYSHEDWPACGQYTARDDGLHVVTPQQQNREWDMVRCVEFSEHYSV